ncbi:Cyclic nucleotide-binding protein [Pseudocohnilembus persalinus]|uniref:Cyclic nucleotide-binding protein n=1 Tax=Pseudocohnilembus persalinus TaxID=266149 RepID=A0A0V0Q9X7_PSEPJ|nr:Cyclic nucleotide-binding protein [Pseudocohnilembus persalinus]|eukprot:KRW98868.1 Cyclic nucleotide-binding protein [Pseudocohnilembus persalinus]
MDLSYVSDETSIQQLHRRNSQKKSSFNLGIPIQHSQFSNIHQQFQSPVIDSHMPIKEMAEDNSSKESTIQKSIHKKSSSQQQLQLNQQQFSTSPYQQQYQSQNDQNSNSNYNIKMSNQQINSNFNINNLNASQNIKSSKQESGSQIDVHLHPSNATPSRPNYTQSNLSLQSMTNSIVHKKYQEPNKGYSSGSSSEFELQIENLHKQNKNDTIEVFNHSNLEFRATIKQDINHFENMNYPSSFNKIESFRKLKQYQSQYKNNFNRALIKYEQIKEQKKNGKDSKNNSDLIKSMGNLPQFLKIPTRESENEQILPISKIKEETREQLAQEYFWNILKEIPLFFYSYSREFLKELSLQMHDVQVSKNQILQNKDDRIYILISGKATMLFENDNHSWLGESFIPGQILNERYFLEKKKLKYQIFLEEDVDLAFFYMDTFLELIQLFPKDFERYCSIKENSRLNQLKNAKFCTLCQLNTHNFNECNNIFYNPNKNLVLTRYLYDRASDENSQCIRKKIKRQLKIYFNAYTEFLLINSYFPKKNVKIQEINPLQQSQIPIQTTQNSISNFNQLNTLSTNNLNNILGANNNNNNNNQQIRKDSTPLTQQYPQTNSTHNLLKNSPAQQGLTYNNSIIGEEEDQSFKRVQTSEDEEIEQHSQLYEQQQQQQIQQQQQSFNQLQLSEYPNNNINNNQHLQSQSLHYVSINNSPLPYSFSKPKSVQQSFLDMSNISSSQISVNEVNKLYNQGKNRGRAISQYSRGQKGEDYLDSGQQLFQLGGEFTEYDESRQSSYMNNSHTLTYRTNQTVGNFYNQMIKNNNPLQSLSYGIAQQSGSSHSKKKCKQSYSTRQKQTQQYQQQFPITNQQYISPQSYQQQQISPYQYQHTPSSFSRNQYPYSYLGQNMQNGTYNQFPNQYPSPYGNQYTQNYITLSSNSTIQHPRTQSMGLLQHKSIKKNNRDTKTMQNRKLSSPSYGYSKSISQISQSNKTQTQMSSKKRANSNYNRQRTNSQSLYPNSRNRTGTVGTFQTGQETEQYFKKNEINLNQIMPSNMDSSIQQIDSQQHPSLQNSQLSMTRTNLTGQLDSYQQKLAQKSQKSDTPQNPSESVASERLHMQQLEFMYPRLKPKQRFDSGYTSSDDEFYEEEEEWDEDSKVEEVMKKNYNNEAGSLQKSYRSRYTHGLSNDADDEKTYLSKKSLSNKILKIKSWGSSKHQKHKYITPNLKTNQHFSQKQSISQNSMSDLYIDENEEYKYYTKPYSKKISFGDEKPCSIIANNYISLRNYYDKNQMVKSQFLNSLSCQHMFSIDFVQKVDKIINFRKFDQFKNFSNFKIHNNCQNVLQSYIQFQNNTSTLKKKLQLYEKQQESYQKYMEQLNKGRKLENNPKIYITPYSFRGFDIKQAKNFLKRKENEIFSQKHSKKSSYNNNYSERQKLSTFKQQLQMANNNNININNNQSEIDSGIIEEFNQKNNNINSNLSMAEAQNNINSDFKLI